MMPSDFGKKVQEWRISKEQLLEENDRLLERGSRKTKTTTMIMTDNDDGGGSEHYDDWYKLLKTEINT